MSSPIFIAYRSREDATPEAELNALAAVYRLILDSKRAARPGDPNDGTKFKEDSANAPIIPRR
jgi:hypothetical protein